MKKEQNKWEKLKEMNAMGEAFFQILTQDPDRLPSQGLGAISDLTKNFHGLMKDLLKFYNRGTLAAGPRARKHIKNLQNIFKNLKKDMKKERKILTELKQKAKELRKESGEKT